MAPRTRSSMKRFYANIAARTKAHSWRYASSEQLVKLRELLIENRDGNLFLLKGARHAKHISNLIKQAKSVPESIIEVPYLIERFFAQFDLGVASKWAEFEKNYPDYNPRAFKWGDYMIAEISEEDEKEALEGLIDPKHHDMQQFRQEVSLSFGEGPSDSDNHNHNHNRATNNPNNHRVTNPDKEEAEDEDDDLVFLHQPDPNKASTAPPGNFPTNQPQSTDVPNDPANTPSTTNPPLDQPTNTSEEGKTNQPDTNPPDIQPTNDNQPVPEEKKSQPDMNDSRMTQKLRPVILQTLGGWIKHYEEFEEKVGEAAAQNARQNVSGELLKYIKFYGVPINNEVCRLFMGLYKTMTFADVKAALDVHLLSASEWLLEKGFLSSSGERIKTFSIRLNSSFGINPNPKKRSNPPTPPLNPPAKRNKPSPINNILIGRKRTQSVPLSTGNANHQHQAPTNPNNNRSTQSVLEAIHRNNLDHQDNARFWSNQNGTIDPVIQQINPTHNMAPFDPNQHYGRQIPPPPPPYFPWRDTMLPSSDPTLNQPHPSRNAADLDRYVENLVAKYTRPADPMTTNHYHQHIEGSITNNQRSIDSYCSDYIQKQALLNRICDIAKGQTIDSDTRKLCNILNTKTNKEVAKELQGIFSVPFSFFPSKVSKAPFFSLFSPNKIPPDGENARRLLE